MGKPRSLPVLMPSLPDQRWSCHSCGRCCRELVVHLSEEDRRRLDRQKWESELGEAPYVRAGRGWVLPKTPDGACVFLDENNRCRIHAKFGEAQKPLPCRIFPFSVRPVPGRWQASLRFDCPSVASNKGKPLARHHDWLAGVVRELDHNPPGGDDTADLVRNLRATASEIDALVGRLICWFNSDELSFTDRLIGAARLTQTLSEAKLSAVRGDRFAELLDLLLSALPRERTTPTRSLSAKLRGMLRQLAFSHAEHVTIENLRAGTIGRLRKKWDQLIRARRFLAGEGPVPTMPGFTAEVTFDEVEAVSPYAENTVEVADLLHRYVSARLIGRSVFGQGYYGWAVCEGLAALWLSIAAGGWLARCLAAGDGRTRLCVGDVSRALGVVDRAATRAPSLGSSAERLRLRYFLVEDGVAALVAEYAPTADQR